MLLYGLEARGSKGFVFEPFRVAIIPSATRCQLHYSRKCSSHSFVPRISIRTFFLLLCLKSAFLGGVTSLFGGRFQTVYRFLVKYSLRWSARARVCGDTNGGFDGVIMTSMVRSFTREDYFKIGVLWLFSAVIYHYLHRRYSAVVVIGSRLCILSLKWA